MLFFLENTKIKSDTAWKYILKALFEDFVEFFMPDLYTLVDFSVKPRFLDQEFEKIGLDPINSLIELLPQLPPEKQAQILLGLLQYIYPKRKPSDNSSLDNTFADIF